MLYVKIMSGEDLADTDPRKNYTIVPVENNQVMKFDHNSDIGEVVRAESYVLRVDSPDGCFETHYLTGNAYVMNERGQTIASHACDR